MLERVGDVDVKILSDNGEFESVYSVSHVKVGNVSDRHVELYSINMTDRLSCFLQSQSKGELK